MERSRLPLPSLLGLLGALLMLSLELPMGRAARLSDVPITDAGLREAIAFTVQQINHRRNREPNYFKVRAILTAKAVLETRNEYFFKLELGETTCRKVDYPRLDFATFQMCQLRNQQKLTCNCKLIITTPARQMREQFLCL